MQVREIWHNKVIFYHLALYGEERYVALIAMNLRC